MKIPVIVVRGKLPESAAGEEVIHLASPLHRHVGDACVACAAIGDVRVSLYELLEARRLSGKPLPVRVVIDASEAGDTQITVDRLLGKAPAVAMRDHVVARNFELSQVL